MALITGASRGIGRAIALAFAAEGAAVSLVSRDAASVKPVADEIAARGGRALPLAGDVAKEEDVRRFVAQSESALGPTDVLVNNAGTPGDLASVAETPSGVFERVVAVNLTGPFLCSREVLKGMVARAKNGSSRAPGRIIHIGSVAGKMGYPGRSPYASSKWGLIGLTLTMAEELGPMGIRVNCICPGPVETEMLETSMTQRAGALGVSMEKIREMYASITMMRRMVPMEDVAALAVFLASGAAAHITGQAIDVSGGMASAAGMLSQAGRRA